MTGKTFFDVLSFVNFFYNFVREIKSFGYINDNFANINIFPLKNLDVSLISFVLFTAKDFMLQATE